MKYDATNTTLIVAIVSLAKQVQCDWSDTNNATRLEECEFYMDAVKEGLEIIRTLVDMALKDYPAHKAKKGGEEKTLNADEVIAWLVGNIIDFEDYVRAFKKDFGL